MTPASCKLGFGSSSAPCGRSAGQVASRFDRAPPMALARGGHVEHGSNDRAVYRWDNARHPRVMAEGGYGLHHRPSWRRPSPPPPRWRWQRDGHEPGSELGSEPGSEPGSRPGSEPGSEPGLVPVQVPDPARNWEPPPVFILWGTGHGFAGEKGPGLLGLWRLRGPQKDLRGMGQHGPSVQNAPRAGGAAAPRAGAKRAARARPHGSGGCGLAPHG